MAGPIQFQTLPVAIPVAVFKAANLSVGLPIRAVVGKKVAVVPFLADAAAALHCIGAASVVTLDDSTLALPAADSEHNSTAETAPHTTIVLFEEESQEWGRPTDVKGIRDRLFAWSAARTEGATLLMCCGSCMSALPELRTIFAESGLSWRVLHRVYAPVPSSRDGQAAPAAAGSVESTTLQIIPPRQLRMTASRDYQPESGAKASLVLDFDWTMIECNSDPAVIESLGALQHLRKLSAAVPRKGWTQLMDEVLLHAQTKLGKGLKDIEAACDAIKVAPELVEAIRRAAEAGVDVIIVSDANSEYIRRILESNGMSGMVGQVHTNPAVVQENMLRVLPHTDPPPLCPLCPTNLCKGSVVGDLLASEPAPHSRLVYCGDGAGDFCPSSLLGPQDFVLTRRYYPSTDSEEGSKMTPLYRKLTEQGATFLQLQAAAAEAEVGAAEAETGMQVSQGLAADAERRMVHGLVAASCIAWDTPSELATAIEALLLRDGL